MKKRPLSEKSTSELSYLLKNFREVKKCKALFESAVRGDLITVHVSTPEGVVKFSMGKGGENYELLIGLVNGIGELSKLCTQERFGIELE